VTLLVRDPATYSPMEQWLATLPPTVPRDEAVDRFIRGLTPSQRATLPYKWHALWARPTQHLPDDDWDLWFIRAGRGFGKTRTGAEAVRKLVTAGRHRFVTLIAPTAAEGRDVVVEGPSGLLAVHPPDVRPTYEPSKRLLTWPNGAVGHVRSAEEPDAIRGLNHDLVWGDEPASWKSGRDAWDQAVLGNRIGRPRAILTGTPRPLAWLKELEAQPSTIVSTGSTYENRGNLAPQFIDLVLGRYEGTRLGRQELWATYLEDVEGALWTLATIELTRLTRFTVSDPWSSLRAEIGRMRRELGLGPVLIPNDARPWRIVVGVDPPGETAECGIIVVAAPRNARTGIDHAVVLDDMSLAGPPETWGGQVVAAVKKWHAELAVVEANQGGDMTRSTIHAADTSVTVKKVRATQSKYDRAEPVSVQYARGFVHHAGYFKALEDQQTTWVPTESKSPDRLDALVHAVTFLLPPVAIPSAGIASTARR
jgi:phage terminase large subunit-like protein